MNVLPPLTIPAHGASAGTGALRRARRVGISAAVLWLAAVIVAPGQMVGKARQDVTRAAIKDTRPLKSILMVNGKRAEGVLVGRTDSGLIFERQTDGQPKRELVHLSAVQGVWFDLTWDRVAVSEAAAARDWARATALLHPSVYPAFAYLDLPENNAIESVAQLGDMLLRQAADASGAATNEASRAAVRQHYVQAFQVLQLVARVPWYAEAQQAAAQSAKCLMDAGDAPKAQALLATLQPPLPDESGYGLYWLLMAQLAMQAGDVTNAMQMAINTVAFANKDVDTFPDALLLSGICYDQMDSPYRARDIFLEVASIFPGTDWAAQARVRLRALLESGRTDKDEVLPLESVFFGIKEDLNAEARKLLESDRTEHKPK